MLLQLAGFNDDPYFALTNGLSRALSPESKPCRQRWRMGSMRGGGADPGILLPATPASRPGARGK